MNWLELICSVGIIVYAVFILGNILSLRKFRRTNKNPIAEEIPVSIIIPARNEEKNILACLESIASQNYPKHLLQILVVNDHSEDKTAELAFEYLQSKNCDFKLLHLSPDEKGKKSAIQKAVGEANGSIIITRDADSKSENSNWIATLVNPFQTQNADLVMAPVILTGDSTFVSSFQQFENLAIIALGSAMAKNNLPFVCSGSNLAYRKELFKELNPYKNNLSIPSGDDMFLLKKAFVQNKKIVATIATESIVKTKTETGFKKLLSQRLRWSSKTGKILTGPVFFTGLILFSGNISAAIALISPFVNSYYLAFGLLTLTIKLVIDFVLLFLSARMFNAKPKFPWFLPAFIFNILYTPTMAVASVFARPAWKGRKA